MKHNQNQHWIEKINTWAIQQEYAGYDTKTGEIIYYDESIKELIEKD